MAAAGASRGIGVRSGPFCASRNIQLLAIGEGWKRWEYARSGIFHELDIVGICRFFFLKLMNNELAIGV